MKDVVKGLKEFGVAVGAVLVGLLLYQALTYLYNKAKAKAA